MPQHPGSDEVEANAINEIALGNTQVKMSLETMNRLLRTGKIIEMTPTTAHMADGRTKVVRHFRLSTQTSADWRAWNEAARKRKKARKEGMDI